ncbi:MAG TPA: hypothetical protein VHV55_02560 [Pirellulales bacterium]|nr:hypothetical protein [Pirellulales bacterium]
MAAAIWLASASQALAAEDLWQRLPTSVRGLVLAALLGLILIAAGFFVFVRMGASFTRRRLRQQRSRSRLGPDHWAARRLLKRPAVHPPHGGKPPVD